MRRGALCLIGLVSILVLAGCGDSEPAAPSPEEEQAAISATTIDYLSALVTGDGETACGILTDEAADSIVTDYNASNLSKFQGVEATDCNEAVESFGSFIADFSKTSEAETLEIAESATDPSKVTLTSDTSATITVEQQEGEPPKEYELVKEGDAWLLVTHNVTFT
jgi:hypothetical protein